MLNQIVSSFDLMLAYWPGLSTYSR